jgi:AraC-like DNA-binding protein
MAARRFTHLSASGDTRIVEDVDAIPAMMADGLRGEYVQLESRPFRCRWTTVRMTSVVAQFASEEVAVARRLRVPADRWAFIVPLAVSGAARWNARAVRETDVVVCPPGTECLAFDPPATRFAIVTASTRAALVAAVRPLFSHATAEPIAVACGAFMLEVRDRLARLRDRIESGRRGHTARAEASVEAPLAVCLCRSIGAHGDIALSGCKSGIVRLAEEFFRSHMAEGVSVAQLSTIAGVSERSLRNAFYDVYTTSPKRYMKLWQLHQVRRALRSGDVRRATVTDVATCHGFYELGRFAGAYKSLFGEAPSETLNKARHRAIHGFGWPYGHQQNP